MNSKELLERTGISRATLNNYIGWGIVPRPEVLPPEPGGGAAPRIGYFAEEVAARIEEIQRLKREGWSMSRIAEHFGAPPLDSAQNPAEEGSTPPTAPATSPIVTAARSSGAPKLSVADIAHPAYLVDHSFNVLWCNEAAGALVLPGLNQAIHDPASRNVFKYLAAARPGAFAAAPQILHFHLGLARQQGATVQDICRDVPPEEAAHLARWFEAGGQPPQRQLVSRVAISATPTSAALFVYALQFREGTLFAHVPGTAAQEFASLLAEPAAIGDPGRKRLPVLSHVALLVTDLQDSGQIWAELPAEEYFDLVNQIWVTVEAIFTRRQAAHGKHPGDGMVGYFFPQPDASHLCNALLAAQEIRDAMRGISKQWQLRKGWATDLYMNTGLDEGQQWLGALRAAGQLEFSMQGVPLQRALRISEFARSGGIWATKNLVARLSPTERRRLTFGVRRKDDGPEAFVASTFSTVDHLASPTLADLERLKDIARLPITEVVEFGAADAPQDGVVPAAPN